MTIGQSLITIAIALIAALGGIAIERMKQKRELSKDKITQEKEAAAARLALEQSKILDDAERRRETEEAAREILKSWKEQATSLRNLIDRVEIELKAERAEKVLLSGELFRAKIDLEYADKKHGISKQAYETRIELLERQVADFGLEYDTALSNLGLAHSRVNALELTIAQYRLKYGELDM